MTAFDSRTGTDAANVGDGLRELLGKIARNIELGLRVAAPATVVSYNAATQRADLTMGFIPVVLGPTEVPMQPISLPQVPVAWPRTAAGYLTFPIVPGDTGLVVFNDRNLGEWLRLGAPTDPKLSRTHDLADGVFLPGLHPDTAPITPATSATATVIEGPLVALGAAAPPTNFVALAQALYTYLDAIFTAWTPVPNDGGAALKAAWEAAALAAGGQPWTTFQSTKAVAE